MCSSYSGADLNELAQRSATQMLRRVIHNTGIDSKFYRFPGGSSNTVSKIDMQDFIGFLFEKQIDYYDWNVSSGDGGSVLLDVHTLYNNVTSNLENYSEATILFHDSADKSTTEIGRAHF